MISKTTGSIDLPRLQCVNPIKNKWLLLFNPKPIDEGFALFNYKEYDHQPDIHEIKSEIFNQLNKECTDKITSGLSYQDTPIWLSIENQQNFTRDLNMALLQEVYTLVIYKLGTDEKPVLKSFETLSDLIAFNKSINEHINSTLSEYRQMKDSINWSDYGIIND